MGGYQNCTGAVGFPAQEFGLVHSEAVPAQTEGEDMADIGVDFAAGQDEDAVATRQFGGGFRGPKIIVFREANSIESAGFSRLNQIIYGNETVIGFRVGVSVQIDQHWNSRGASAGGNHITERSPVETRELVMRRFRYSEYALSAAGVIHLDDGCRKAPERADSLVLNWSGPRCYPAVLEPVDN